MSTLQSIAARIAASAHPTRAGLPAGQEADAFDALLLGQLSAAITPDAAPLADNGAQDMPASGDPMSTAAPSSAPADAGTLPLWLPATPRPDVPVEVAHDAPTADRSKPSVLPVTLSAAPVQTEPSSVGLKSDPQPAAMLRDAPPDAASLLEPPTLLPAPAAADSGIAPLPADVAAPSAASLPTTVQPCAPTPARALPVATPMGHPAWAEDFSRQVTWLAGTREQQAELHLNPPQLGPVEIRLHLQDDQARVLFVATQGPVREAIEQALPKLREALADNGIMLGNATVSDQPPREQRGEANGTRDGYPLPATPASVSADRDVASTPRRVRHHGMVDTYA